MKKGKNMNILNKNEILNIHQSKLPLLVLSFNYRNLISSAINIRRKSHYNHLMWLYAPGKLASQGITFTTESLNNYLDHHRLKLWYNPSWTPKEKLLITQLIHEDLQKPKWRTRYDCLAILGQLLGLGFIQNPLTKICSDYGSYLKINDPDYNLKYPAPDDVNSWLKKNKKYKVFGRYISD
jgi:hypothetical protein